MRCEDARERLSRVLDGMIPPPERVEVEAHLAGCAACSEHLAALRRLLEALKSPPIAPPGRVWERLEATLEDRRRHPARRAICRWAPRVAAAAAGVLVALVGLLPGPARPAAPPTALTAEEAYLSALMTSAASSRVSEPRALKVDPPVEGLLAAVLSEGRKP